MNILKHHRDVPDADMPTLLATYQHYAGRAVKRFESRAVAERRVTDAMMASQDARGHLGVPRGANPQPAGHAELVQHAADSGRADPAAMVAERRADPAAPGTEEAPTENPYPPGTLAAALWAGATEYVPTAHSASSAAAGGGRPRRADSGSRLAAVYRCTSRSDVPRVLPTSERGKVLAFIAAHHPGVALDAIVAACGPAARGCVGKLLSNGNIIEGQQQ